MKSSIQDVAQLAHVSISTVSRSFTRPDLVSAATREKVMKAADELNFSISRSAAALKTGRALRIAVLVSGRLNLWFSSSIIEGLNQVFHDEGYDISIYQMSSIEERREFFDMLPVRRNVDAVIVISFDIDSSEIKQLKSVNVPIIGINSIQPEERGFDAAVRIDDKQGSELAARHLMTLGHSDIAYIRTDRDVTLHFSVQGRFESFMACCATNGITPRVLVTDEGKNNISKVVTQLLSLDHMPTAIACQEDGIAVPLLFQLERNDFTVPNDISIIGYDDSTYARDLGLTTVRQEPVKMAQEAARMTLSLIEKQPLAEPFTTFPAQLIVRHHRTPAPIDSPPKRNTTSPRKRRQAFEDNNKAATTRLHNVVAALLSSHPAAAHKGGKEMPAAARYSVVFSHGEPNRSTGFACPLSGPHRIRSSNHPRTQS